MYDAGKIIPGLIIFVGLITFPIWYTVASGKAAYTPEPEIATEEKECVETAEWMRENHPGLLAAWRNMAVREGQRTYLSTSGKEYSISLTGTCLDCHSNKKDFCDTCHSYTAVTPGCWDCHTIPEEKQ